MFNATFGADGLYGRHVHCFPRLTKPQNLRRGNKLNFLYSTMLISSDSASAMDAKPPPRLRQISCRCAHLRHMGASGDLSALRKLAARISDSCKICRPAGRVHDIRDTEVEVWLTAPRCSYNIIVIKENEEGESWRHNKGHRGLPVPRASRPDCRASPGISFLFSTFE